ncbi:CbtA family protein [Pseudaminobacter sp. 19-2017]|uniref:CbtA family protein n=1 Tax=Pseudaminobacter soli (ex Zhang et al. 2022) TaxID=2831468 RepID=A0A942DUK7_9HYPH|nr:CbtA family protein [Pseudaminobacter soli]MBS3647259.1 CbtA family protein [Pseudaminobacter soli]
MTLFRNVVFVAALAGLLASLVMTGLQAWFTVPLILKAETYESAEPVHDHDHSASAGAADASHSHGHSHSDGHDHGDGWAPADGTERFTYTALANIVSGVGFALLLVAVSEFAGGISSWRVGAAWGFAGFAVFTLAPGLGLPPELPGMPAAELEGRQFWWLATVAATAAGLALIAFRGTVVLSLVGLALIVAPHLIGAPQPASHESPVPVELHRDFVIAATLTSLVFWVLLGGLAGVLRQRLIGRAGNLRDQLA